MARNQLHNRGKSGFWFKAGVLILIKFLFSASGGTDKSSYLTFLRDESALPRPCRWILPLTVPSRQMKAMLGEMGMSAGFPLALDDKSCLKDRVIHKTSAR